MPESGRGLGEGLFGRPRGEPEKPLLEAAILLSAFYLASYLSAAGPGALPSKPAYHLSVLAMNLPRIFLALYIMASGEGLPSFGIGRARGADAARGLLCGLGAFALALAPSFAYSALGLENPLFAQARAEPRATVALIPLFALSAMSTGYCEELFFRAYLLRRLGQAGLPPPWAVLASCLLFAAGHGYQGVIGLASGFILGLFFAWRWRAAGDIHEIAIGHGLFDVAGFAIMLYS
jgi:membrane protease YdiL (CAAX protease family)